MSGETVAPVAPVAAAEAAPAEPVVAKPVVAEPAEVEPSEAYEIDGKQVMLTRTQARTYIAKAGGAQKRMQEAIEKQKKLDNILAAFDSDPETALRMVKRDPDKIIASLLARKAKLELMSPEQQASAKLQEERDALKVKLETLEKEREEEAQANLDQRNQEALQTQLVTSADKYGLDKTPEVLEGLCDVAVELLEYGARPTPDQVAQEYIRRELEHLEQRDTKLLARLKGDRLKAYLKSNIPALLSLPGEELLTLLGPAGVKAIQAATLARVPSAAKKPVVPTPAPAPKPPARNGDGRYVSEAAFDRKFSR